MGRLPTIRTTSRVVSHQPTIAICDRVGINLKKDQLIALRKSSETLAAQLKAIEKEKKLNDFMNGSLLFFRFVKANCDAFLDMTATLGEAVGLKGLDQVNKRYQEASTVADYASRYATGQTRGATDALATANKLAKGRLGGKAAVDQGFTKVDLMIGAVNSDNGKIKDSLITYGLEMGKLIEEAAPDSRLKKNFGRLNALASMSNSIASYNKSLLEMQDSYFAEQDYYRNLSDNQKLMVMIENRATMKKIAELSRQIAELLEGCQAAEPAISLSRP